MSNQKLEAAKKSLSIQMAKMAELQGMKQTRRVWQDMEAAKSNIEFLRSEISRIEAK